jgi:hypothetical protein
MRERWRGKEWGVKVKRQRAPYKRSQTNKQEILTTSLHSLESRLELDPGKKEPHQEEAVKERTA